MTTFAYSLTIASLVLFAGFILLGIKKFGLLDSYSAYSSKWNQAVPINNMNLWSIVTILAAGLLCPCIIETGIGNPWQFLGFLTPVYLITVACTPNWETNKKEHIIHSTVAIFCAIAALLWIILIRKQFYIALISTIVFILLGLFTKTFKRAYTFWGEMAMFSMVYCSLLI